MNLGQTSLSIVMISEIVEVFSVIMLQGKRTGDV
jgi:hypothetical protein